MNETDATGSEARPQFAHFLPEVTDKLQRAADTYLETFNEHQAFTYLIAELYETTAEDRFTFTDGPRDGGIDFVIRDSPAYTIAQCKCPSMDGLKVAIRPPSYDQSILKELLQRDCHASR